MNGDTDIECLSCMNIITKTDKYIRCDGACNKVIHIDCTHLDESAIKSINNNDNIHYICDMCSSFSLKAINNKIDGIYKYLFELNERTKKSDIEFNELKRDIIDKLNTNKTDNAAKRDNNKSSKSYDNPLHSSARITPKETTKQTTERLSVTRAGSRQSISRPISTPTTSKNTQMNKANTTKKPTEQQSVIEKNKENNINKTKAGYNESRKNNNNKIVIKPKNKTTSENVLDALKSKFDPRTLKFNDIVKRSNGTIIIECNGENECTSFKERCIKEMGDDYMITNEENIKPRVKIFGMSEKINDNEIVEMLKSQNDFLNNSHIDVLKIVEDIRNPKMHNAIIQVDKGSFENLIKIGKVSLNWDKCPVKEHYSIMRCHQCNGFDHTKNICTKKLSCGYCSGNHESNKCDTENLNCINCINANKNMNLSLETNHSVWSKKCQILAKRFKKKIEKTQTNQGNE